MDQYDQTAAARREVAVSLGVQSLVHELQRERGLSSGLLGGDELDHLATRMRRNAESLLVLAGKHSPRSWRGSVPVAELGHLGGLGGRTVPAGHRRRAVEMYGGFLLVTAMRDGSILGAIAEEDCDVGLVGYEMAVFADRAGDLLTPGTRQMVCSER